MVNYSVDVTAMNGDLSNGPEAGLEQSMNWTTVAIDDMREILLPRRIATAFLDRMDHHNLDEERGDAKPTRTRVEHHAADLGLLAPLAVAKCKLNNARANKIVSRLIQDIKQRRSRAASRKTCAGRSNSVPSFRASMKVNGIRYSDSGVSRISMMS
jgi:hypothetical protein